MRQVILYFNEEDGYYVAECLSLPGCIAQGETKDDALINIKEAIEIYIDDLMNQGESVPEETFSVELVVV